MKEPDPASVSDDRLADRQLAAAQRDPRLDRDERGIIADFHDYLEEAERTRFLAVAGVIELQGSLEHEARRLDAREANESERRASLDAAAERAALAAAEAQAGHPGLNALTLTGMLGALDALVEALPPAILTQQVLAHLRANDPDSFADADDEMLDAIQRAVLATLTSNQRAGKALGGSKGKPRGTGPTRWEGVLATIKLQATEDRPLPDDLTRALTEIAALRHVLLHRAGRVDETALRQAPTLPYRTGQLVRIDVSAYRTYSAAIAAYGSEVQRRLFEAAGVNDPTPSAAAQLTDWRKQRDLRS